MIRGVARLGDPRGNKRVGFSALARTLHERLGSVEPPEDRRRDAHKNLKRQAHEQQSTELVTVAGGIEHATYIADVEGRVTGLTDAYTRLTGFTPEDLLGHRASKILHGPATDPDVAAHMAACIQRGDGFAVEVLQYARGGRPYWAAIDAPRPVHDDAGVLAGFIAVERDLTARRQHQDRLRQRALHDPLTGLPNGVLLHDRIAHAAQRAIRGPDDTFAVLFVSVDGSPAAHGMTNGGTTDGLVMATAGVLAASVRPGDTVARLDGDEFAVLLEHVSALEDATAVADRILDRLAEPGALGLTDRSISARIGVVVCQSSAVPVGDTLRGTEAAARRVASDARGGYAIFDPVVDGAAAGLWPCRETPSRPALRAS